MTRGLGALLWLVFLFGMLAGPMALAQSTDTLRGVVMEEDSKGGSNLWLMPMSTGWAPILAPLLAR